MDKKGARTEEPKVVEAVQGLVSDKLDRVEAQLDSTVESAKEAVHELRTEAKELADKTPTRVKGLWERMQDKVDAQMDEHPWLIPYVTVPESERQCCWNEAVFWKPLTMGLSESPFNRHRSPLLVSLELLLHRRRAP